MADYLKFNGVDNYLSLGTNIEPENYTTSLLEIDLMAESDDGRLLANDGNNRPQLTLSDAPVGGKKSLQFYRFDDDGSISDIAYDLNERFTITIETTETEIIVTTPHTVVTENRESSASHGFNLIGVARGESNSFCEMRIYRLKFTGDGTLVHDYNAATSSNTDTVFTDDAGSNDAVMNNFIVPDAWVGSAPADTTAPVITVAEGNLTITEGDAVPTFTATTDDGTAIVETGSANNGVVGVYPYTFNSTDSAGNVATEVTRTITVEADSASSDRKLTFDGIDNYFTFTQVVLRENDNYTVKLVASYPDNLVDEEQYLLSYDDAGWPYKQKISFKVDGTLTISLGRFSGSIIMEPSTAFVAGEDVTILFEHVANTLDFTVTVNGEVFNHSEPAGGDGDSQIIFGLFGIYYDKIQYPYKGDLKELFLSKNSVTVLDFDIENGTGNTITNKGSGSDATLQNFDGNQWSGGSVDTTAPVITVAEGNLTITEGDEVPSFTSSTDDGSTVVETGNADTNVPAVYPYTFNATDDTGNEAEEVTRTITVEEFVSADNSTLNMSISGVPNGTYLTRVIRVSTSAVVFSGNVDWVNGAASQLITDVVSNSDVEYYVIGTSNGGLNRGATS